MRYVLPTTLLAAMVLSAPGVSAQRAGCAGCDSSAAVVTSARERVLAAQFAQMSAEIQRLRSELARTGSSDPSGARSLRTTIESLLMSQRHLEEAMREQRALVQVRARQAQERRSPATGGASTLSGTGYVGLTTEARYTVRETGGRIGQVVEFPVIVTVAPGSPAYRAGLIAGDTLIAVSNVDGRRLEQELGSLLRPGETLLFRVRRGDDVRVHAVQVAPARTSGTFTMSERVDVLGGTSATQFEGSRINAERAGRTVITARSGAAAGGDNIVLQGTGGSAAFGRVTLNRELSAIAGARLAPLAHDFAAKLGVEHGLLVLTVAPSTPSARAGLEAGDVIVAAADQPITAVAQLHDLMSTSRTGTLTLRIVRNKEQRTVTLRW